MKQRWINLVMVLAMAGITFSVASCGSGENSDTDGTESTTAVDGVDAVALYKTWCSQCHGDDGKLGLSGAKDLTVSPMTHDEKLVIVNNGKGVMVPYKDILTAEEIEAVVTYVESFGQ